MTTDRPQRPDAGDEHDVVVVGGGPAGCSAGVFCAREGLDTLVFDRGRSSLKRCAYLENYPGFPAGIDVETFYELLHDHLEHAGCELVPDLVDDVDRVDDGDGFVVRTQDGLTVTARWVIAATRYDGEYLRGLDDDGAMFEADDGDGSDAERFDRTYADHDGTTPVDGLYVASPSEEADRQAVVAAGRGARVAHRVIEDARLDDGWWSPVADPYDWVRRDAEREAPWTDREHWVEWFDEYYGPAAPVDPDTERYRRVRETYVDERLERYVTDDEIERRTRPGHRSIAERLDPDAVVDALGEETLLGSIDDASIRAYLDEHESAGTVASTETEPR